MSLRIENLRVAVGSFRAEVPDLEVQSGEICCLMGKSGSGKSTILSAAMGFLPLESGRVLVRGQTVEGVPPEHRKIALVFQRATLFPFLTVFGNIEIGLKLQGIPSGERARRVNDWLEKLELTALSGRLPHQLSEGQGQRVQLARALITGFPVVLLDEPFSSLDLSTRRQMRELLQRLVKESQVSALMVTHHPDDALSIADRIVLLDEGIPRWSGAPAELPKDNALVKELLGNLT